MGCCIKPKIRSANDQQARNPTSTPSTDKMTRFLNSSRCARSGMDGECGPRATAYASAMGNSLQYPFTQQTIFVGTAGAGLSRRCHLDGQGQPSKLFPADGLRPRMIHGHDPGISKGIDLALVDETARAIRLQGISVLGQNKTERCHKD